MKEALELDKADLVKKINIAKPAPPKTALIREIQLLGEININGPFLIPPDTTINEIIYNFGGGIPQNKNLKAVQFGLENGICISQEYFGLTLESAMKMAGFTGKLDKIVFLSNEVNMVMHAAESIEKAIKGLCGKCIPCREGTMRVYEVINKILDGDAEEEDMELLEELAETIKVTSLCRLGKISINTVESTLSNFREEYIALIDKKDIHGHASKIRNAKDEKEKILREAQIA